MAYVGGTKRPGCVFCNALAASDDRDTLILHRGDHAFIMLNLYPYNSGHSMIVPVQHVANLDDLQADARAELLELATLAVDASRRVFRCDGFNLGLNLGAVAGAGVADHLHMHVVPRWTGDANFMPILGDTMVMPEILPATYARLRGEIEAISGERRGSPVVAAGAIVAAPGAGIALSSASAFPVARIEPGETASGAALRAVRHALGVDAGISGWAGIVEESGEKSVYFLVTTPTVPTPGRMISLAELGSAMATSTLGPLLEYNRRVLAHLVGDYE